MKKLFWLGIIASLLIGIFTRFSGLTRFPPSLYWEEAALGYDAYSILKTGKDVHGHVLPVVAFESFGDYKPSFYFYTLVPSIAVFGLSDFAVRFPSALSGVLLIVGVGLIAQELELSWQSKKRMLMPIAMLIASLSPWAIEFSRGGWEVNVATTLLTFGLWLQLKLRRTLLSDKKIFLKQILLLLVPSVFLIALSMYTYHSTRVIAPLLLLIFWSELLFELWKVQKLSRIRWLIGAGVLFTVLIAPVLFSLRSVQTQQRFAETSLFADGRQVKLSNQLIENTQPHWLGKILYHRYVISAQMILENYLSHFSFKFLFGSGDANPRHSTQFVGLMYTGEIVLLWSGLYFFIKKRNTVILFLGLWLLVGVLPAALTTATPHALRILPSLPIWIVILSCGVVQIVDLILPVLEKIIKYLKFKSPYLPTLLLLSVFILFYGWQFAAYWRFYSVVYPKLYSAEWQYGYPQMIKSVMAAQQANPGLPVQITREQGRPSTYYWFYTKTDPKLVQAEEKTAKKDQGEFLQYQNVSFVDQVMFTQPSIVASSLATYEMVKAQHPQTQLVDTISDLQNKPVWQVYLIK